MSNDNTLDRAAWGELLSKLSLENLHKLQLFVNALLVMQKGGVQQ